MGAVVDEGPAREMKALRYGLKNDKGADIDRSAVAAPRN
jgi:hypothetical protein